MAGAHIILVTRGSKGGLSISDEQSMLEYVRYFHVAISAVLVPADPAATTMAYYDDVRAFFIIK